METEGFLLIILGCFLFNSADTCGRTVKLCEQWWAVVTAFSFVNSDSKISGKHDKVKKNSKLVVASGQNSAGLVAHGYPPVRTVGAEINTSL